MEFVNICEIYRFIQDKYICVFGAGRAGSAMFFYLKQHNCARLFVADNDVSKHRVIEDGYEIGSFEKAVALNTDIYLVGFLNNDKEKVCSVIDFLLDRGILKEKIICIDFNSDWLNDLCAEYTERAFKQLKLNVGKREGIKRIVLVGNLYNEDDKKRRQGGAIGAVNMQRILLGSQYSGLPIECMIYPKTWITKFSELFNKYNRLLFGGRFLASDAQRNDAVYIANDIFSAYSLARYGQKYVLLYHGQGDFVSDRNAFDAKLNDREKKFITHIEKEAVKHSYKTFFPSKGARKYFLDTINGKIDIAENDPLYNSIYDFPAENYKKHDRGNTLFFFSIGQMTRLKGMDQIPDFLDRVRKCTGKKIYWTVVAGGELKDYVVNRLEKINISYIAENRIEYEIIDSFIDHQKIYQLFAECDIYLMLHRISIFDFSTLEAMYMGKPIILSEVDGNDEFSPDNNIFLINEYTTSKEIKHFVDHKEEYGIKNRKAYDTFFSQNIFKERYYKVFQELIDSEKTSI